MILEVYLKDCDYAESVIAKKYNTEIAGYDIARSKHIEEQFYKIIEFEESKLKLYLEEL